MTSQFITSTHSSFTNILATDSDKKIWIMGSNDDGKTGVGTVGKPIYVPVDTGIQLQYDDEVDYFYCHTSMSIIFTKKGNLFVSQSIEKIKEALMFGNRSVQQTELGDIFDCVTDTDSESSSEDILETMNYFGIMTHENREDTPESIILPVNNQKLFFSSKNTILSKESYELVSSNIDGIVISHQTVLFTKKNKIFVYDPSYHRRDMIVNKGLNLSAIQRTDNTLSYYELIFPFQPDKVTVCDTFIYFHANNYHHILFISECFQTKLTWIYFTAKFKISYADIFISASDSSVFVKKSNDIYKYDHTTHTIEKLLLYSPIKIFPLMTNDGTDTVICTLQKDGLWVIENARYNKICEYNHFLNYFVDINYKIGGVSIILVDIKDHSRYFVFEENLFFNIHDIYYKLTDEGVIYYDNGSIFFCTNDILAEHQYGTMEIENINVDDELFYIYLLNGVPDIDEIAITNEMILIKSQEKHYYYCFTTMDDELQTNKFMEIILYQKSLDTIEMHLINRQNKYSDTSIELNVNIHADKLVKFMNIVELIGISEYGFNIVYVDNFDIVSHGDGPKREFMESAINQFSDLYLTEFDVNAVFNMSTITELTGQQLYHIGIILHLVICHSDNPLPIRLPLSILKEIKKTELNIDELEYFLKRDIPDVYRTVSLYKNPEKFKELDSDFDNYYDLLCDMCGLRKKYVDMSQYIAKGFLKYSEVKNLELMNYMTLDYYVSGNHQVNKALLLKNLRISPHDYQDTIIKIINGLSDEQLLTLLVNWSGTKIVRKNDMYHVIIIGEDSPHYIDQDVLFTTCNITLHISVNLINDLTMRDSLISILSTPIQTMIN